MTLQPKQVAWLGRIAEALPEMLDRVPAGESSELRLGERRRRDSVVVEVPLYCMRSVRKNSQLDASFVQPVIMVASTLYRNICFCGCYNSHI